MNDLQIPSVPVVWVWVCPFICWQILFIVEASVGVCVCVFVCVREGMCLRACPCMCACWQGHTCDHGLSSVLLRGDKRMFLQNSKQGFIEAMNPTEVGFSPLDIHRNYRLHNAGLAFLGASPWRLLQSDVWAEGFVLIGLAVSFHEKVSVCFWC